MVVNAVTKSVSRRRKKCSATSVLVESEPQFENAKGTGIKIIVTNETVSSARFNTLKAIKIVIGGKKQVKME
jgi:hypothetical protein